MPLEVGKEWSYGVTPKLQESGYRHGPGSAVMGLWALEQLGSSTLCCLSSRAKQRCQNRLFQWTILAPRLCHL